MLNKYCRQQTSLSFQFLHTQISCSNFSFKVRRILEGMAGCEEG